MKLNEYQLKALETAVYEKPYEGVPIYPALGLAEEAGEAAGKIKRRFRGETIDRLAVAKELGDTLWYLAVFAHDLGYSLEEIALINNAKLSLRKEQGLITGSGDNRGEEGLDLYEPATERIDYSEKEEPIHEDDELGW